MASDTGLIAKDIARRKQCVGQTGGESVLRHPYRFSSRQAACVQEAIAAQSQPLRNRSLVSAANCLKSQVLYGLEYGYENWRNTVAAQMAKVLLATRWLATKTATAQLSANFCFG
jgi:hypothetical protein